MDQENRNPSEQRGRFLIQDMEEEKKSLPEKITTVTHKRSRHDSIINDCKFFLTTITTTDGSFTCPIFFSLIYDGTRNEWVDFSELWKTFSKEHYISNDDSIDKIFNYVDLKTEATDLFSNNKSESEEKFNQKKVERCEGCKRESPKKERNQEFQRTYSKMCLNIESKSDDKQTPERNKSKSKYKELVQNLKNWGFMVSPISRSDDMNFLCNFTNKLSKVSQLEIVSGTGFTFPRHRLGKSFLDNQIENGISMQIQNSRKSSRE